MHPLDPIVILIIPTHILALYKCHQCSMNKILLQLNVNYNKLLIISATFRNNSSIITI